MARAPLDWRRPLAEAPPAAPFLHQPPAGRHVAGARWGTCGAVWADAQYGLEPTLAGYLDRLVGVFDQVRRVLTPTGTCWLNIGDGYSSACSP